MRHKTILSIIASVLISSCGGGHVHEGHDEHEGHDHEHEDGVIHFSHQQAEAAGLTLETIVAGPFEEVIHVSGQVMAAQGDELALVAKSNGVVTFTRDHLTEGSQVKAGETIGSISARGIAGGDAVAQSQVALAKAKAAYDRASVLIKDSIISQKAYEEARSEYESARLAAEGGKGSGSAVVSPLSGFVKNVMVRAGEYVEIGQVIATVTKVCNLQLRAEVPEKYFASLSKVRSANFQMGYDKKARSLDDMGGHLIAIGKTAEDGSAYIPVTFEFLYDAEIVPGAFADIWLITGERDNVLSVPVSALTEEQGVFYVYVMHGNDGDEFEKREVSLGGNNGRNVEILSGIKAGDKVVTHGVYQVKVAGNNAVPEAHSHSH